MRIWRRPSFYFLVIPFLGIAAGSLLHEVMGCGYECTGPITGPIDRVALFFAYLFGYGLPMFMALTAIVFAGELACAWLIGRGTNTTLTSTSRPDDNAAKR